jgi:hypothetical protein
MDSEAEIINKAEMLARNEGWSKLKALSILHSRYPIERRLEEALRVKKLMDMEESKRKYNDEGVFDEP